MQTGGLFPVYPGDRPLLCKAGESKTTSKEREKNLAKKRAKDGSTVNSSLIRRPIQRWFPLFILPTFVCFFIGFLWPFLEGIYLSFCKFNIAKDAEWVGAGNYEKIFASLKAVDFGAIFKEQGLWACVTKAFESNDFLNAFKNTFLFAIVSILLINVVAFAIAYALTRKMRGANALRTVFFMPNLIGGLVLGYIWSMIFEGILKATGLPSLLLNSTYGFWGLVILVAWQQIGYMMIIYISGLQSVPEDMLEAAKIDGANGFQTLFKVIIPNVMPSITICTFLTLTNSFKLFDQNMALTGGLPTKMLPTGQPVNTTELLALNIKSTYDRNASFHGQAQAKAVIFFVLVAILAITQLRATRKKEVQQ